MTQRRPLIGLIVGGLLIAGTSVSAADRYFTWVDEHGRVRHTLIKEETNPVDERAREVERAAKQQPAMGSSATDKESTPVDSPAPTQQVAEPDHVGPADEASTARSASSSVQTPLPARGESGLTDEVTAGNATARQPESAAGRPATAKATQPAPDKPQQSGAATPTDDEYTLENYPDGDELAKKGFIREGDPLPYYTWRDAQGNVRVDYYRPEPGFEKASAANDGPALSSALVLDGSRQSLPDRVNRETLKVLGIDRTESLIQSWMDQCCEGLPVKDLADWDDSREFQLDFDDLAPEFTFSTGDSIYRLVRLPEGKGVTAFVLQLRTYIDHGVFVPTLAFLDKDMQTQRLVTDLVFDFRPESWHSHGFLEARVPVFPDRGDHWLLIMSRQEDQAGQTVVETEKGPEVIPHADHGLLGLAQIGS